MRILWPELLIGVNVDCSQVEFLDPFTLDGMRFTMSPFAHSGHTPFLSLSLDVHAYHDV
jgi:hypothetical protein